MQAIGAFYTCSTPSLRLRLDFDLPPGSNYVSIYQRADAALTKLSAGSGSRSGSAALPLCLPAMADYSIGEVGQRVSASRGFTCKHMQWPGYRHEP